MTSESLQDLPRRDTPGVIAPPPLIYLSALAVGFALELLLPSVSIPGAVRWPLGVALVLGGFALARSFVAALHRADTPVDPRRATTAIVTTGPYRLTRNPGYLGMTLAYAGIAVLSTALWPFATLVAALVLMDRAVIAREERYLERTFGADYERYRREVRRWL
jgi:protein-S-isoprenylcysteine O-methyltransferase Ste14